MYKYQSCTDSRQSHFARTKDIIWLACAREETLKEMG